MGAIYAELHVAGRVFVLRRCTYGVSQATGPRGRPIEQVRHNGIDGEMDVPRDPFMKWWAAEVYMPLAGYITFSNGPGEPAIETVSWEAGQCVGYGEKFQKGSITEGSYICRWRIVAATLVFGTTPPKPSVAPAPREHGTPQGYANPTVLVPPSLPPPTVIIPFEVPVAESLGAAALRIMGVIVSAPVLVPAALTLALILAAHTPAGGPGIPQVVPANPDELRLRELVARHAAGTLTAGEEAELIALLGKVKGIHVRSLDDLNVQGPLRGGFVALPGFHSVSLTYTKRSTTDLDVLRRKFNSSGRVNFLKHVAADPAKLQQLKAAGLSDVDIKRVQTGKCPVGYQVHHKLPLDDGGDNSFNNLMFIKNEPYHLVVTNVQNTLTGHLQPGQTTIIEWPMYDGLIYPATPQP